MILQAFAQWRDDPDPVPEIPLLALTAAPIIISEGENMQERLHSAVQKTFPILDTDAPLRRQPTQFEAIRNNYSLRNDFSAYTISPDDPAAGILQSLGFNG
jgi:hypothetical protein